MRTFLSVTIFSLFPLLAGCVAETPYHVVVKNAARVELSSVTVRFGSFHFNFGFLSPGISASYMFANERAPLPETVELSWIDGNGKSVVQHLSVKSKAPAGFSNLYVTFLIMSPATATVRFEEEKPGGGKLHGEGLSR